MNWRLITLGGLGAALLFWVLARGFGHDPHAVPFALANKPAPDFRLQGLDDKTYALTEFRGRPVVMNFWSSWCTPCQDEHPVLQTAARHYGDRVQFLGVIYQDSRERALSYLSAQSSSFPQLLDTNTRVAIDYGIAGVPETFIIDANGVLRAKLVGPASPDMLRAALEPLLTAGSTP